MSLKVPPPRLGGHGEKTLVRGSTRNEDFDAKTGRVGRTSGQGGSAITS